jgi:hypothetical protein
MASPHPPVDTGTAVTALMTDFFMEYLRTLYREFDGDFALLMTLGEIGQANLRRFVQPTATDRRDLMELAAGTPGMDSMSGCSALAAAMASGVPRETARRKVLELEARGWITRGEDGHWYATPAVSEHFDASFHPRMLERLLETSDAIRSLMSQIRDTRTG